MAVAPRLQATTLFAVRGPQSFYTLHATGHNTVSAPSGNNAWVETASGKPEGEGQAYLVQKSPTEAVKAAIDELLLMPPPPSQPRAAA
eukprot:SAG22_NODE_1306_length_4792_cov_369.145962_4_plen_88_part_00